MKKRFFRILVGLLIVGTALSAIAWFSSYRYWSSVSFGKKRLFYVSTKVELGHFEIVLVPDSPLDRALSFYTRRIEELPALDPLDTEPHIFHSYVHPHDRQTFDFARINLIAISQAQIAARTVSLTPAPGTRTGICVYLPCWAMMGILAAFPFAVSVQTAVRTAVDGYRRRRALREKHCATCNYDLRMHWTGAGARCPECGTPVPPRNPTATPVITSPPSSPE